MKMFIIFKEIDYIKETSVAFNYSTKSDSTPPTKTVSPPPKETKQEIVSPPKTVNYNGKYFSATAISKELGLSSKDLNYKIEKLKWIERKNDEWVLTSLGKSNGATMKTGQYGEYIAYPETIIKELK